MLLPEWATPSTILLAWPTSDTDWNERLADTQGLYIELISHLIRYQDVVLLIQPQHYDNTQRYLTSRIKDNLHRLTRVAMPYNDTWLRDSGPLSVIQNNALSWLDFQFNGWGQKHAFDQDTQITRRLMELDWVQTQVQHRPIEVVLEGGSVETNGQHLLLTTTSCVLNKNRAANRTREELNGLFNTWFGTEHTLWLEHGHILGDDTDGHIDTLARFCDSNHIVFQACDEPSYPAFSTLRNMAQELKAYANTHQLTLTPLPWPSPCYDAATQTQRLPATYANFLIGQQQIIVPQYQVPEDVKALEVLAGVFPQHQVIGLNCRPLIEQGGSLHCITMQLPQLRIPTP